VSCSGVNIFPHAFTWQSMVGLRHGDDDSMLSAVPHELPRLQVGSVQPQARARPGESLKSSKQAPRRPSQVGGGWSPERPYRLREAPGPIWNPPPPLAYAHAYSYSGLQGWSLPKHTAIQGSKGFQVCVWEDEWGGCGGPNGLALSSHPGASLALPPRRLARRARSRCPRPPDLMPAPYAAPAPIATDSIGRGFAARPARPADTGDAASGTQNGAKGMLATGRRARACPSPRQHRAEVHARRELTGESAGVRVSEGRAVGV
jgi:hypothetical protein